MGKTTTFFTHNQNIECYNPRDCSRWGGLTVNQIVVGSIPTLGACVYDTKKKEVDNSKGR